MKFLNKICYVIGTICIVIALYILFDKYVIKENVRFDVEEEINILNDKLNEIGSPLGWIIIVDGINNQDDNGNYVVAYNEDLLDNYSYRQLFVMEYILSNTSNYEKFVILSAFDNSVLEGFPTDDYTLAYLEYNEYNSYYKSLFGEDFDVDNAKNGNTSYDDTHVYYENRRAGSNGVYVSMIQADSVEYEDGIYRGNVTVTYSTRASELVGNSENTASIEYTKDINGNIILKSFTLKDS